MRVLAIGDTHAPFNHPAALDWLRDCKRVYKPDVVVHIGDLGDQHGWSRHGRLPEAPGQTAEDDACLAFCRGLYKIFPRVKACIGNHDVRLAKASQRVGLPPRLHLSVPQIYDSPAGWEWADSHIVDGVAYMHGDGYGTADCAVRAAKDNRINTVVGHIHSVGGVRWTASQFSTIFGASTGCLIDPCSVGMAYARKAPAKPVLGSVVVLDRIPHFIPLEA